MGKKSKDKKKKKKKGKDKKESEEEVEEEEDQTPSVLVSLNAEMPEGVEISDGDEDDENDAALDDPHKALGAINLDDLDSKPAYVPIDTTKDQIGDMFGSSSGKKIQSQTDDNAKSKKKKSKEKKEKKSKKSKKSISDPDQLLVETDRVVQVNGSNNKTENAKAADQAHDQTDDLEFWLSPSNHVPAAPSSVEKPQQAQEEPPSKSEEKSKKKHKKKSSKHDKHSEKQVNGIGNSDLAKVKSSSACC